MTMPKDIVKAQTYRRQLSELVSGKKNPFARKDVIEKSRIKKTLKRVEAIKKCPKCNQQFVVIRKINKDGTQRLNEERKYCTRKCANSHIQTNEINRKRSTSLIETFSKKCNSKKIQIKCKQCNTFITCYSSSNRQYCSNKCAAVNRIMSVHAKEACRLGGLKSAEVQATIRRSKNEILFAELCKHEFKEVKMNERVFNGWDADVILPELKIAILWNGKWHREKITKKHSVEQVKNRDKIKQTEIERAGYTCYIIEDNGKFDQKFVESKFNTFKEYIETR